MTFSTINIRKTFLKTVLVLAALGFCLSAQAANDVDLKRQSIFDSTGFDSTGFDSTGFDSTGFDSTGFAPIAEQSSNVSIRVWQSNGNSIAAPQPRDRQPANLLHWLADNDREFRTKSEVVREVKERYDARVLKITLDEKRAVYRVRILMPGGKVRNVTLSAKS